MEGEERTVKRHDWECVRLIEKRDWFLVEDLEGSQVEGDGIVEEKKEGG